jgi:hypothetical protein
MSWEDSEAVPGCDLWYRLALVGADGSCVYSGAVSAKLESAPRHTALHAVVEPAGGGPILIRYDIAAAVQKVRLAIHDVRGRELWSSVRAVREPGEQVQVWDRHDHGGARVSRGVYFVRLDAGGVRESRKLVLLHR